MIPDTHNLIDLLRWRALNQQDVLAHTFLLDGETEEVRLTYQELDRQARTIGAWLQRLIPAGDRVLLLYPPGLEFIAAFFGCLYAGAVAVPAYPPRRNRNLLRLQSIVVDAQASLTLTTSSILSRVEPLFAQNPYLSPLRWLATDGITEDLADDWQRPAVARDSLAFLQYTSGSTGLPKGVMLTHGNLLHNAALVYEAVGHQPGDKYLSWLPTFHDMGFMAGILQPLYGGFQSILMSPASFLQRPLRWLQAITRYRATTSGGPNFAFNLCARKISAEQKQSLDLSSWTVAFNGAEPIRLETLEEFAAAFKSCGFRREVFYPCYGLAEATLMVSGGKKCAPPVAQVVQAKALQSNLVVEADEGESDSLTLVGCGKVLADQKLIIADPETLTECAPESVGEVWLAGPSVAQGYWNNPQETERTFQARLSDTDIGPFLRTGDLGFLRDGELFITGRHKDLVIIRGLNHYPQDIELTVERCDGSLRAGCGAAFSIEAGSEERLVIVQEVDQRQQSDLAALKETICQSVALEHEVQVHDLILIAAGSIPKTSSGKIQRHACRAGFLERSLEVVAEWRDLVTNESETTVPLSTLPLQSLEDVEELLVRQFAAKLGVEPSRIDVNLSIDRFHLDSLMAIELMHVIEGSLGVVLPIAMLLQGPSINELASHAFAQLTAGGLVARSVLSSSQEGAAEHPLSHEQQALWFLYKLAPESTAYHIAVPVSIKRRLDAAALRHAFQTLVERHASLRTTFMASADGPIQRIHEYMEVYFNEEDATEWSEEFLNECLVKESHRPFNLESGPLLRVNLFQRSEENHIVLFVVHHIVADFWSLAVLMHELGIIYEAETKGSPVTLTSPSMRYTDYVNWQDEMLSGAEGERLWSYWREQLAGELPVLNLMTDKPRPAVNTYRGASQSFKLSAELTERLRAFGRAHGATLYMTLLAAFKVLLYRYTNQPEILVGSPTAGRSWAALKGVVGYFVNPIVIRSHVSADLTFVSFLKQVRQTVLRAFEHQDFPFALLVERLQPARDVSRSPIFQAMFVLQKTHLLNEEGLASFALGESGARLDLASLSLESINLEQRTAQFDLTLMMAEVDGMLSGSMQFNTDLFDPETITRQLKYFRNLLESIVADPNRSLLKLPLMTRDERQRLLLDWNRTPSHPSHALAIHHLFEQQALRSPDHTALIFHHLRLSYRQLNSLANQLAHFLLRAGIGPESLVALSLNRSSQLIVALLAILKSGAAYLPLDPAYPSERIRFMLEDADVSLLISEQSLLHSLPQTSPNLLLLDPHWNGFLTQFADQSEHNPDAPVDSSNLAYVIYTSGSTGQPKGVAIEHHSAVTLLQWAGRVFPADSFSGVLASTSICFDLSVFEIFAPLAEGGTIILAENALHLPVLEGRQEVRLINTVPSAMSELLRLGAVPESVRVVNLAGEPLTPALAREVYEQGQVEHVYNLYGPTEDTTYSSYSEVKREATGARTPIGRPIDETQFYILDRELEPVVIGAAGELYIGGRGLARGYVKRAEVTAERFVPDLYGQEGGGRLYRTGDVARYRADGEIEFLGRADQQVKVRGYRIELGEIEAALMEHEGVRESVVIAREEEGRGKRLVAYIVREEGGVVEQGEVKRGLREKLPEYMIPSAIVELDALPLTPNGKINRSALPMPDDRAEGVEAGYVAARTPVEEILCGIWSEVLRVERVGIHDNFFELGGHSLLATQVAVRTQKAFPVDLPLLRIFDTPTVNGLAEYIEQALHAGEQVQRPPLVRVSREQDLPLSFAQQRIWFLEQLSPGTPVYNMPGAIRLKGRLEVDALRQSLNLLAVRHESLRTAFRTLQDRPTQIIAPALSVELPIIDLSHLSDRDGIREAEVQRLMMEEAGKPFDLTQSPLLRTCLLKLGTTEHVLLFTLHHIIGDGWSVMIMAREMAEIYKALAEGQDVAREELPIQYADFAVWQRELLEGTMLEEHLKYWREQLAGAPAVLELPTDHPRPLAQTACGARQLFDLPKDISDALDALSRRESVTLFMTLLAAFQSLLSRYTHQKEVVVGTPIAGRTLLETEGLIGCFVNTLVLRSSLAGNPSFVDLLKQTREATLGAYAHQELPFEKLVEELHPERDTSRTPLFQVMFTFQDDPVTALELPGLTLTQLEVDSGTAKFELMLSLERSAKGLRGAIEYNTDLFEAATIERMAGHFRQILKSIVADPTARISDLQFLSDAEQQQLLVEFNRTEVEYSRSLCLHELFERQAKRTPDRVALISADDELSYSELNRRANRLAHRLTKMGIGPEKLVAVCMERSSEMVMALLGILKAGGAYVPLDPAYPQERLSFTIEDAQASVILTQHHLLERLPASSAEVLCLDTAWPALAPERDDDPASWVIDENTAYLIYTSGSTGKPKGVVICHGSAATLVQWAQERFEPEALSGVLASTSICFDLSVFELFVPLSIGGAVILANNALELPDLPHATQVSLINTVPSAMTELVRRNAVPPSVRIINLAGEPLSNALVQQIYGLRPEIEVYNLYGPSEDTTYSTFVAVRRDVRGEPTIGRPIANTQAHILDEQMQLMPVGTVGELYLGGEGLARGYLRRPDLTAERFVPNPFARKAGARLYKTGDLARYRADGEIEFLGRLDHQVKIRGFRIELGEIEATLLQHPSVRECLVQAQEYQEEEKRLVAYIVSEGQERLDWRELRELLKRKLPEHMMPGAFVQLDAMPLTPNGKVDRRALPAPEQQGRAEEESYVAPRNATEEMLCGIWSEVLRVERIGIHDNFFELGGHSLLAAQVVNRVNKQFGVELPLRSLFETPMIESLCQHIIQKQAEQINAVEMARILEELEHLSDDEARSKFTDKNRMSQSRSA